MITEEEIKKGSIDPFEHMTPSTQKVDIITYMRLLDIIPVMEQNVLDEYINSLTDKGIFKQIIKAKLNDVSSRLEKVNREVYKTMNKSGDKSLESNLSWYDGYYNFARKFTNSMIHYIKSLEILTNVSEVVTSVDRDKFILNNSQLLHQLNPGDIFLFLDTPNAIEYTFNSLDHDDNGYYCKLIRVNSENISTIEFKEDKLLRPVIKTNLLTSDDLLELKELLSQKSLTND